MSGDLQILLVFLFATAAGVAALIYHLRTRGRSSQAQPVPSEPGSAIPVTPDSPEPGVKGDKARSAATTEQSEIGDDHGSESEGDKHAHMPAESSPPTASSEEALPSDVGAVSGDEIVVTEDLAKAQAARAEQPAKSPDEVEVSGPVDRENSVPVRAPEVGPGKESSFAVQGLGEAEDSRASPEQGEVVEEINASQDDGEPRQDQPVQCASEESGEANADRSPQSAETAATAVAEGTDRQIEEQTPAGAAGPDEATGAGGVVAAAGATSTSADEQPLGPAAEEEGDEPSVEPATTDQHPRKKRTSRKNPHKYKGLVRAAPQLPDAARQPGYPGGEEPAQRERSLAIEVRLRFDRGGCCSVSLIAKRSAGLSEDLKAVARAGEVNLRAMQDEWYQDVVPDDFSDVLRNGTVWTQEGENGQCTWSLSGRDLYVLAGRSDISGYVSQPCLDLGRDHVVLCTERLRSRVEKAIRETGAQPTTVLDESFGAPPGWIVFRNIVPNEPVPPADDADIFNALRPLARIEISLERGIRLGYANWLDGHPPSIRVYGDPEHASEIHIDGRVAERMADDTYRAYGWDAVGSHSVWCAGTSRSYSIVPFEASWELWDAYGFLVADGRPQRLAVCGPIIRAATTEPWGSESLSVPETNPVLLGPEAGQIVMAVSASPLRGASRIASPGFRPIWALPHDPLHSDKRTTRILCVARSEPAEPREHQGGGLNRRAGADVAHWYQLILDANRKGMTTDPDTESVRALWLSYKRLARRIWRSRR